MTNPQLKIIASVLSLVALCHTSALASPLDRPVANEDLEPERVCSPYAGRNYPNEVLFGDTHFHTNLSFDAGLVGTSLGVDEGFRFARGEKVISNSGQPVQLKLRWVSTRDFALPGERRSSPIAVSRYS